MNLETIIASLIERLIEVKLEASPSEELLKEIRAELVEALKQFAR